MEKLHFDTLPDIEELYGKTTSKDHGHHIVVYNDDVNTFEHVIDCFVDILGHSTIQAEQSAIIIHDKGKCSVKNGVYKDLIIYRDQLISEGIDARIHQKD